MPELETRGQVLAYHAEYWPSRRFAVMPFEYGWVVLPQLPPEQAQSGMSVGLGKMVLDKGTGQLFAYPSWSIPMVVEAFTEMKQTGAKRAGLRVYPYQRRIHVKTRARVEADLGACRRTRFGRDDQARAAGYRQPKGVAGRGVSDRHLLPHRRGKLMQRWLARSWTTTTYGQ